MRRSGSWKKVEQLGERDHKNTEYHNKRYRNISTYIKYRKNHIFSFEILASATSGYLLHCALRGSIFNRRQNCPSGDETRNLFVSFVSSKASFVQIA